MENTFKRIPTVISYTYNDLYSVGVVLHREDGPSQITYDKQGNPIRYAYHRDGYLHRLEGPAVVRFNTNSVSFLVHSKHLCEMNIPDISSLRIKLKQI
jgi:hypothetical protein